MNPQDIIKKESFKTTGKEFANYINYFISNIPNIDAIILYGSCVNQITRKPTSYPDFYILLSSYKNVFKKRKFLNFLLAGILPPSSFFLYQKNPDNSFLKCKYNLIKTSRFLKEISLSPSDFYNLGRFGKKTIILYVKNKKIENQLISAFENAVRLNLKIASCLLEGKLSLDEIVIKTLSISYLADYRVERDTKVSELFNSEKNFYLSLYKVILEDMIKKGEVKILKKEGEVYLFKEHWLNRIKAKLFILWSKIRSVMRWPKGILTFDNYVDYLIDKIERAKGIKIELSERERKYPLIFGWKYFFRLKRQGMIK